MAKAKKADSTPAKLPVTDRTIYYSELSYMPTDYKESKLWMAESLFFARRNSDLFQEKEKAIIYRKTDRLEIDELVYKNLIDPSTPKDANGGKAAYFSSDWKANPIGVHIDNILDAEIRTIPQRIECSLADPIAKLQEQKDKEKIIAQGMVRNIINDFAQELGYPAISESSDPYKWIQNFTKKDGDQKVDEIGDVVDQIKTKIKDDDGLRLFQSYLYKNGLEVAFEVGIRYYLLEQNEFQVKYSQEFLRDIKHFNKMCGLWTIDQMTGQGQVRYIDPTTLYTSPFKDKNGDDILYYFFEENVSFADYERLVGAELENKDRRQVLQLQKEQGFTSGSSFNGNSKQNNSQIRIGFFGILTQEANVYAEKYVNDTVTVWENKPLTWEPEADQNEIKKVKCYNVGYSCNYIPLTAQWYQNNNISSWQEQSRYIYNIKKDIDMMRYGVDRRYSKLQLVIYKNDHQASWTDIKESYMPKIHTLWHRFQNAIVQDVQGMAMSNDLIGGMLNAVDGANKEEDGGQTLVDNWKMLRQSGMGWFKFTDKNGNLIADPSKLFIPVDTGQMKKAEMYLTTMMELYNMMVQALAKGGASEGAQPAARTPAAGIEIANQAAGKATYFIEEAYTEGCIIPFAYRCAHHLHTICKEKTGHDFKERWKIFNDVIGNYSGAVLEGISDIQFANIGLTIASKDDSAKREMVFQQIIQQYAQKGISTAGLALAISSDNWKLQLMELWLEQQKSDERNQALAAQQQQNIMEQKAADLKIAQAMQGAKTEGKNSNIQAQGSVDAQLEKQNSDLKAENMKMQKDLLLKNKLIEKSQQAELNKDVKTHEANLDTQKSLIAQ